ncbi:MAG: class I SAM-dependent methyltransferase [Desulfobacterales bacterium]|jgi:SAM-dependent methyltransferase
MGHVFDFREAKAFEQWLNSPHRRIAAELETRLMMDMLAPMRGESLLDIGCGTGSSLFAFLETGVQVTGIDPSPYMLDIAIANVLNRVDFYRCYAEDLPFDDNSFNYASLVTTLEFVDDPYKALEEACRVAKDRIFIGVLNRYAIKGLERRVKGIFVPSIFNRARFFSVWELKQMIYDILGDAPVSWRTVCQLPGPGKLLFRLENSKLVQRCPFGAFAGMVVSLVPRFRTRPLTLRYRTGNGREPLPGMPLTHLNRGFDLL